MPNQRFKGDLWCFDVLAKLSDYVDGDLRDSECQQLRDHLAGCSYCEDFGAEFQSMLGALREGLSTPAPPSESLKERVLATIASDANRGGTP